MPQLPRTLGKSTLRQVSHRLRVLQWDGPQVLNNTQAVVFFHSLSHFPALLSVLPGLTSQVNY